MRNRRRHRMTEIIRTGILPVLAGCLLFLYHLPWTWMQENVLLLTYGNENPSDTNRVISEMITAHIPLYSYAGCDAFEMLSLQSSLTEEDILLAEGRDEEKQMLFDKAVELENARARGEGTSGEEEEAKNSGETTAGMEKKGVTAESMTGETPVAKKQEIDFAQYSGFDAFLRAFYVVDKTTYITEDELNGNEMLKLDLTLKNTNKETEETEPQVLIYHTHSQEAYADSVPGDESTTVVGAGERLAEILQEDYGISVLHHTGQYDVDNRDYAYANAQPQLEKILEEHPSIEVVIDLHRDGVADSTRLVTEIDGKPTAQFMFFNGLSRLKSTGEISYLENKNRAGNLAFSFQLQVKCMEYYPGLARSIYLKGYRYNMQYREKSLLVELGAQTNTVEEVYNAIDPLAKVLAMVLLGEEIVLLE